MLYEIRYLWLCPVLMNQEHSESPALGFVFSKLIYPSFSLKSYFFRPGLYMEAVVLKPDLASASPGGHSTCELRGPPQSSSLIGSGMGLRIGISNKLPVLGTTSREPLGCVFLENFSEVLPRLT